MSSEHALQKLGHSVDVVWLSWMSYWNKFARASLNLPLTWWKMLPQPTPRGGEAPALQPAKAQNPPDEQPSADVSSDMAKRARRIADLQRKTKAELYEYAKERGIEHRSHMSKAELVAALIETRKS